MKETETTLSILPGYFIAIIEDSQMTNVNFKGDDKFDLPQTGELIKLAPQDAVRPYNKEGDTYGSLIGRRVAWAKYAESDCKIFDNKLQKDVVLIALDKMRGYE